MQETQTTAAETPARQLEPEPAWPAIGAGISLAAMCYPAITSLIILPFILLSVLLGWNVVSLQETLAAAIQFFVLVLLISGVTLLGTAVLCIPVLFLVWLTLAAIGVRWSWHTKGVFAGGVVGYMYVGPFIYFASSSFLRRFQGLPNLEEGLEILFMTLLGPVLATFVGQVGGACGGLGLEQRRCEAGIPGESSGQRQGTFSIRQLLGLTLVVSVAFAVLRVFGLLNVAALITAALWFVCQAAGHYPALKLARRLRKSRRFGALVSMPATPTSTPPVSRTGA